MNKLCKISIVALLMLACFSFMYSQSQFNGGQGGGKGKQGGRMGGQGDGKGGQSGEMGGGQQDIRGRMTQLLSDARSASDDEWTLMKKKMLSRIQSRMEQQNTNNPEAIPSAIEEVGIILDDVRSLSENQYKAQQEQLLIRLMKSMGAGMGRGMGPETPNANGEKSAGQSKTQEKSTSPAGKTTSSGEVKWIDVHNHLVGGRQHDYAGATKAALEIMDQIGIQKMIVMPPPGVPDKTAVNDDLSQLSAAVKKNSARFAFMGGGESLNIMLHQTESQTRIPDSIKHQFEQTAKEILRSGAIGFGEIAIHHLSLHGEDHPYESVPADHPLLLLLADTAAKHDVPIDVHFDVVSKDIPIPGYLTSPNNPKILQANLAAFERLLAHNPNAKICWAHAGSDNIGHWTTDLSRRLLEKYSNLYMSLRLGPGHFPENFPMTRDGQIRPEWLSLFQDFPTRFVIGSDNFIPSANFQGQGMMSTLTSKIPATREIIPKFLNALPPDLARKIGIENAVALYKLKK